MAASDWSRVVDLFHAAREKSAEDRIALLDSACSEDRSLRAAVERLLLEDDLASGYLSTPLVASFAAGTHRAAVTEGQTFGRYVALSPLGAGGMGEVWKARDTTLNRLVALKFLKPELGSAVAIDEITREARAASALNPPNIVTVHEWWPGPRRR